MRSLAPRRKSQTATEINKRENEISQGHLCPINELNNKTRSASNYRALCPVTMNGFSSYALVDS